MGAYLSSPNKEKKSENSENSFLKVGASQMQGWRINQEDSHNLILDFDDKTAFMAVFDGHGGSEVAEYCSLKLAEFLKQTEAYKQGNLEEALKEAFLGFDATLLKESVVEELKILAKNNPDYADEDEMEEEVYEDIQDLRQEATMPLNKVLEKYKTKPAEGLAQSPCLKGKKFDASGSGGPSSSGMAGSSGSSKSTSSTRRDTSDATVSSSSCKPVEEAVEPSSSSTDIVVNKNGNGETPDSSSTTKPDKTNQVASASDASSPKPTQNGEPAESSTPKSDEAITSSSLIENGEVGCSSAAVGSVESVGSRSGSDSASSPSASAKNISSSSPVIKKPVPLEETDSDESTDDEYKHDPHGSDSDEDVQESEESEDQDEEGEEAEEEEEEEEGLCDEDETFMNQMMDEPGKDSGCTAVVAVLKGRELYVANAGDSRCIVSRGGRAVPMSFDHKPEDEPEFERIRKAGGRVSTDGRVNGGLNLSRAIGDHGYKDNKDLPAEEQMISAVPDIKTLTLCEEDEFMVLACDGIWNFMTNDEVRDFVKERLDAGKTVLSEICEDLFEKCLAPDTQGDGTGCDNMTAMIVLFKPSLISGTNATTKKRSIDSVEINENLDTKRQKIADAEDEAPATVTPT